MNAKWTSSVAQADESHGYLTSSYGSVWLSLRQGKELGREAFIEGSLAATAIGNHGRSRVILDVVTQLWC